MSRGEGDPAGVAARGRRGSRVLAKLVVTAVVATGISLVAATPWLVTFLAVLTGVIILGTGVSFLRSFATPLPPPPDPGEMRKVKLIYRCEACGAEVRMTAAPSEEPEPPRHCMEDMELQAPGD